MKRTKGSLAAAVAATIAAAGLGTTQARAEWNPKIGFETSGGKLKIKVKIAKEVWKKLKKKKAKLKLNVYGGDSEDSADTKYKSKKVKKRNAKFSFKLKKLCKKFKAIRVKLKAKKGGDDYPDVKKTYAITCKKKKKKDDD